MGRFRDIKTLQKFAAAHASIHDHFNLERHLNRRETFKQNRAARWPNGVNFRHKPGITRPILRPVRIGLTTPYFE